MATTPEGIMALNQPQDAAPQLSYEDSYDAMRQALQQTRPDADLEMQDRLDEVRGDLEKLTDEQLQAFIDAVQTLYDEPENYKRYIAEAVQDGDLDQGDFPEEYDENFLATVLVILRDEQRTRKMKSSATAPMEMMLPQQFARGGIAEAARIVASKGRYGDTMLAHITPAEARLLKARGGAGAINPETGLPEFFLGGLFKAIGNVISGTVKAVGNVIKAVVNVAKDIVSSPIGRVVATIGLGMLIGPAVTAFLPGLSTAAAAGVTGALASGAVTAIGGGSLKDILVSSAVGFLGAPGGPVSNFVGNYTGQFISNPAVNAAVTGAIVGTGAGLVQGQSLGEAVQSGLVQGAIAGGTAYMQSGNTAQASEAAKNAAADAAEEATAKASGKLTDAMVKKGYNTSTTPNSDGTFTTEIRDPSNNLVSRTVNVAAPAPAPVPTLAEAIGGGYDRMIGNVPNAIDDAMAIRAAPTAGATPGTTAYNEAIKADVISRGMGTAPPSASDIISRSMARTPSVDALKEGIASKGIPVSTPIGPNAPVVSTYGQPTAPISLSGTAEELSDAFEGLRSVELSRAQKAAELSGQGMGLYDRARAQAGAVTSGTIPAGTGAAPPYQVPEIGASLKKAVTPGTMMEGLSDLFMPGPSSAQYKTMVDDFMAKNPGSTVTDATTYLEKTGAVPGMLRTYGPGVVAGIGALGAMGGFTPQQPPASPFAQQMRQPIDLSTNPSAYYVQNLPGVQYDERGNIVGTTQWNAMPTMQDIQVATPSYIGYNPMMYPSRFFNMGGIADLAGGGYPRRVGQISGPGTEKSDSIPAMLSDGEFVMTARAVRGMGNGSRREGAKKMYALMHKLETNAARG